MKDGTLKTTRAMPAAEATSTSDAIDLNGGELPLTNATGEVTALIRHRNVRVDVAWPALAAHTNTGHTYTFSLTHCDTSGGTYTAVPATSIAVAGVASTGPSAQTISFYLPPSTQRFVKIVIVATATTGDNTAQSMVVDFVEAP